MVTDQQVDYYRTFGLSFCAAISTRARPPRWVGSWTVRCATPSGGCRISSRAPSPRATSPTTTPPTPAMTSAGWSPIPRIPSGPTSRTGCANWACSRSPEAGDRHARGHVSDNCRTRQRRTTAAPTSDEAVHSLAHAPPTPTERSAMLSTKTFRGLRQRSGSGSTAGWTATPNPGPGGSRVAVGLVFRLAHRLQQLGQRERIAVVAARRDPVTSRGGIPGDLGPLDRRRGAHDPPPHQPAGRIAMGGDGGAAIVSPVLSCPATTRGGRPWPSRSSTRPTH
jgi:hypothetical protein